MQRYLEDFERDYDLGRLIRYGMTVSSVRHRATATAGSGWVVTCKDHHAGREEDLIVDAVAVCNGHYSKPFSERLYTLWHRLHQSPRVIPATAHTGAKCASVFFRTVPDDVQVADFGGRLTHSHNYRVPEPFAGQTVVVVGLGPSALDISREISAVVRRIFCPFSLILPRRVFCEPVGTVQLSVDPTPHPRAHVRTSRR